MGFERISSCSGRCVGECWLVVGAGGGTYDDTKRTYGAHKSYGTVLREED